MTFAAIRSSALIACAALALHATDTVEVVATVPTADEQGLVPGKVTFIRSSTSGTLSINYRLAGTARSDLHGGHVAGATLPNYPNGDGSGYSGFSPLTTLVPGTAGVQGSLQTEIFGGSAWFSYVFEPGSGYLIPAATVTDVTGTGARLAVAVTGGAVSKVAVEYGGSGYAIPSLTISGGGGSGATGRVIVQGGRVIGAVVTNSGSGYTAVPTISIGGAPAVAAVVVPTVDAGKIIALTVTTAGSGYVTPTIAITGATGAGATAEATVDNGVITSVTVTAGGANYGSIQTVAIDEAAWPDSSAIASVRLCGPEYVHPNGTYLLTSGTNIGQLQGSITFSAGEKTKEVVITPLRNAVGGGRKVVALVDPPLVAGAYTVGVQSSATVTINDADDQATVRVVSSVAYPMPPVISPGMPVEVQGRAEWRLDVTGDPQIWRSVQITVDGEPAIGPTATQTVGTTGDYLLVSGLKPIEDTAGNFQYVNHTQKPIPRTDKEPGVGSTQIGVPSTNLLGTFVPGETGRFSAGDVVCFENPTNEFNGVYIITAIAGESDTTYPVLTIFPGLRKITTGFGVTRIRRLGQLVPANNYTRFSPETIVYYFGIAWNNGDLFTLTPRAHKSMQISLVQSSDYRRLSPTSGGAALADTSVVTGLRFGSNASKPNTAGFVDVVFDKAFPVDVTVPFMVFGTSTAVAYNGTNVATGDYTLNGLNPDTLLGQIKIPAGQTSARLQIQPRMLTPLVLNEPAKTVEIGLVPSVDYQIAPQGTSPVNPTASVLVMPLLQTTAGENIYIAITKSRDGVEGSAPVNGEFVVSLGSATGAALVGTLTQDLVVPYAVTGTATADTDYIALPGQITIPAGSSTAAIAVRVNDDVLVEGTEGVTVDIVSGPGYQLSTMSSATVLILDDEPVLTVTGHVDCANESTPGSFTVSNANIASRPITFGYTVSGTATPGTDYVTLSGTGVIPANQGSITITVTPIQDLLVDPGETVILTLKPDSAVPATYALGAAASITDTLTIIDDDLPPPPTVTVSAGGNPIEGSTPGSFLVSLSAASAVPITVRYTVSGTATAGTDYTALPGTLVVGAGTTTATIGVAAASDGVIDLNETVILTLASDTNVPATYSVGTPSAATLTIQDDGATAASGASAAAPVINPSSVPYMGAGSGGGGGGGCGVGSGLGLVGLGAGLALAAFLRRRRNAA